MIFYIISIINIVIMIALISIIIIIAIIVVMIINSIIIIIIESGAHRQLLISFPIAEDIVRTTSKQNIDFCNHNILSVISRGQGSATLATVPNCIFFLEKTFGR